ncbi:hypothetical protein [Erythrobacter crassostreae]|uniref:Uncharacterized protein n=1 Tax=Erythrobacter crassostreae TaxID=2828328 RepID=A0A9X1F2B2_9SPHN|nr:hypothetical protein [Erythrobacter crassostrea]MBV7259006.1 hypothetical protein [Erythrobacter crassostrea]
MDLVILQMRVEQKDKKRRVETRPWKMRLTAASSAAGFEKRIGNLCATDDCPHMEAPMLMPIALDARSVCFWDQRRADPKADIGAQS